MSATNRISGKDVYISFAGVDISTDETSVTINEEGNEIDLTAHNETEDTTISTRKKATAEYEGFYASGTAGTAIWAAVAPQSAGTLIIGPAGTASGSVKWLWTSARVRSRNWEAPFDDGVTIGVSFTGLTGKSETTF